MSERRKTIIAALVSYVLLSTMFFGHPLRPLTLLAVASDRIPLAQTAVPTFLAIASALVILFLPKPPTAKKAALSITAFLCVLVFGTMYNTQKAWNAADLVLKPDKTIRYSLFSSLRNAPADFQFHLHGAALKDCKPFAWSYREMDYYALEPNTAPNVLPRNWIEECQIERESR